MESYNEVYLEDAMDNMALCFDYLLNDCQIAKDDFIHIFLDYKYLPLLENGNPRYLCGMSGIELGREMIDFSINSTQIRENIYKDFLTKEYWIGYYLAYYQWKRCISYKYIFNYISLDDLLNMYNVYHEMDIERFAEALDEKIKLSTNTNLKRIRISNSLSQSELAKKSGVSIRNIQLYEQKVNDINKAQAQILNRLSKALNCTILDLLEIELNN